MVVTDDADREAKWRKAMGAAQMPVRRVQVIRDGKLCGVLKSGHATPPESTGSGIASWEDMILRLYDRWLRKYKPAPDDKSWKVLIGFERNHEGVESRWQQQQAEYERRRDVAEDGVAIEFAVCSRETPESARKTVGGIDVETLVKSNAESLIVFDNHGRVFPELANLWGRKSSHIYHEFSGRELSLCQALESPPEDPFSFSWFIYQLVEGSLTCVVIVDERFAEATIDEENGKWKARLVRFSSAGIHAGYAVRVDQGGAVPISVRVERVLQDNAEKWKTSGIPGIHLAGARSDVQCVVPKTTDGRTPIATHPIVPDVIVIHEGIAEDLVNRKLWNTKKENDLFYQAPRIIRTSGRGTLARYLLESHPFIEFSELSEVTYRGLNKPALGRAVLSTTGSLEDPKGSTS